MTLSSVKEQRPSRSASDRKTEPSDSSAVDGIDWRTPSEHLLEISPVPKISISFNKKLKQSVTILTQEENIKK
jgi:hypothetical protein